MKNVNILSISAKFPNLSQNKKYYVALPGKNRSMDSFFSYISNSPNYNSNSLSIHSYNNQFHPIGLKRMAPFLLLDKNISLKSSSNNLYVTGIQYNDRKNQTMKKSSSLPIFRIQSANKYSKNRLYFKKRAEKKQEEDDSPTLKYLGSLIKFKRSKNKFLKNNKKKIIPQEKRQDYMEYINKKRKIFFNANATSNYVHERNANNLINTLKKTKSYKILQPDYTIKSKNPKEEIIEMRDKVPNLPFNTQKLITQIRNLFSQDKFNYSRFNETFYDNFENKINFVADIYRVPIFKNNLVKIILNKKEPLGFEEWSNINVINSTTWNYLNRLKRKIQREKDEKVKREKELELKKKEEEEINFRKKKKKHKKEEDDNKNGNSSSSIEEDDNNKKIIKEEENYFNIMINIEKEEQLKQQQYEDLYIIEEYFLHKNNYVSDRVSIANDKLRYIFFHGNENILNKIKSSEN